MSCRVQLLRETSHIRCDMYIGRWSEPEESVVLGFRGSFSDVFFRWPTATVLIIIIVARMIQTLRHHRLHTKKIRQGMIELDQMFDGLVHDILPSKSFPSIYMISFLFRISNKYNSVISVSCIWQISLGFQGPVSFVERRSREQSEFMPQNPSFSSVCSCCSFYTIWGRANNRLASSIDSFCERVFSLQFGYRSFF